ncbi:MAG: GNAT family N-acetyltransferase [Proteobacteria bacterium]|nr:GNAT family N-acetyltransferase [Pseudomonadota bacterium]
MKFVIRDLRREDRPGWKTLWAGYLEFYESAVALEVTDTTFARLLDPSEPMFSLVAEDNATGELIGMVNCVIHRSTWSEHNYCYLSDLFTSPDARKRGVGRALIEAVYARADELKLPRVYWMTHETNQAARKLYDQIAERSGFIQYRRARP